MSDPSSGVHNPHTCEFMNKIGIDPTRVLNEGGYIAFTDGARYTMAIRVMLSDEEADELRLAMDRDGLVMVRVGPDSEEAV